MISGITRYTLGAKNTSAIDGISRYKMIPTNGDWMPINFVEGWITEAELIANPPPFQTAPAPI